MTKAINAACSHTLSIVSPSKFVFFLQLAVVRCCVPTARFTHYVLLLRKLVNAGRKAALYAARVQCRRASALVLLLVIYFTIPTRHLNAKTEAGCVKVRS
jgi:hypothetical protein